MRQKIGTALHEHLVLRMRSIAVEEGRPFNELLEEAIEVFLARRRFPAGSVVDATAGIYRVDDLQFEAVMEEDLHAVE